MRGWSPILAACVACSIPNAVVRGQSPPSAPELMSSRYVDEATGVSLIDAVQMALQQEPSLRAARNEVEAAQGMRLQAGLRPNPTVSFERRQEPAGTDNQTMLTLEWPLDLFRRGPRVAAAEREVDVSQRAVAERARLVSADVRTRYGAAAAAVREVSVADDALATLRRQLDLLSQRVQEGASPPLDRDLLAVEVRRAESDRLLAMGRADAAMYDLRRALGQGADVRLMLRDTLEVLVKAEPPPAIAEDASIIANRSDVQAAAARRNLWDAQAARAASQGRFDISLYGSYARMDTGFAQRAFDTGGSLVPVRGVFNYVAAGAMVAVPLRNKNQGEVAAAHAMAAAATATLEATRLSAQAEIAAAAARSRQTQAALATLSDGVRLARQNLDVVRQTYELGRMTVSDVLAEQRHYLDMERAYTMGLREAYDAQAALQNARGERP